MEKRLLQEVRRRAEGRCEYSRLTERYYPAPFVIDHIIARQHGGATDADNLALACFRCNLYKGPNIAGIDPLLGELTPLFHPRRNSWTDHFEWAGAELVGRSPIGRVTIAVLAINHPDAVAVRESLIAEGVFGV
jgi:hypothetical protein